jgi:hypothetical protein
MSKARRILIDNLIATTETLINELSNFYTEDLENIASLEDSEITEQVIKYENLINELKRNDFS